MAQMESLCRQLDGIGLLFLANPANPVGNKMEASLLETLLDVCEKKQITVVLDECFIAFTGTEGYVSWIRKYPHLIVVRAYTKIYAIPGIRLGYLLAQKDICEKLRISCRSGMYLWLRSGSAWIFWMIRFLVGVVESI